MTATLAGKIRMEWLRMEAESPEKLPFPHERIPLVVHFWYTGSGKAIIHRNETGGIGMHLETERMYIRNFVPDDAEDLQEILGDSETMKCCEPAYSFEQTKRFLEEFCVKKGGAAAAVIKSSGKVIGYILFKPWEEGVYEMGWIFNRQYWRNGYAYEACSAVIRYGFQAMGLHKVVAETIDAEKSVGFMEKLGMKCEGVQRSQTRDNEGHWADLYLYGLLQDGG